MKTISDIRVFRSNVDNIDGNPLPGDLTNKALNCVIHRIVMKLREKGFSLGEFDHLYVNLTTCAVQNRIAPAKRSVDRYHPWYRFYDAEVSSSQFDSLEDGRCVQPVVAIIEQILLKDFCSPEADAEMIQACFMEALTQGENMLVRYKEKRTDGMTAAVSLRFLDCGMYEPLLRVYDEDDHLLLEKRLQKTTRLDSFGEIRLNRKQVSIIPRRNCFTKEQKPMVFTI